MLFSTITPSYRKGPLFSDKDWRTLQKKNTHAQKSKKCRPQKMNGSFFAIKNSAMQLG